MGTCIFFFFFYIFAKTYRSALMTSYLWHDQIKWKDLKHFIGAEWWTDKQIKWLQLNSLYSTHLNLINALNTAVMQRSHAETAQIIVSHWEKLSLKGLNTRTHWRVQTTHDFFWSQMKRHTCSIAHFQLTFSGFAKRCGQNRCVLGNVCMFASTLNSVSKVLEWWVIITLCSMATGNCPCSATPMKLVSTQEHSSPFWQEEIVWQDILHCILSDVAPEGDSDSEGMLWLSLQLIILHEAELGSEKEEEQRKKKECDHYYMENYFGTQTLKLWKLITELLRRKHPGDRGVGYIYFKHPVTYYAHWDTQNTMSWSNAEPARWGWMEGYICVVHDELMKRLEDG